MYASKSENPSFDVEELVISLDLWKFLLLLLYIVDLKFYDSKENGMKTDRILFLLYGGHACSVHQMRNAL